MSRSSAEPAIHPVLYSDLQKASLADLKDGLKWRLEEIITEANDLKDLTSVTSADSAKIIEAIKSVDTILSDIGQVASELL